MSTGVFLRKRNDVDYFRRPSKDENNPFKKLVEIQDRSKEKRELAESVKRRLAEKEQSSR